MMQMENMQQCLQCENSFPGSKLALHIQNVHRSVIKDDVLKDLIEEDNESTDNSIENDQIYDEKQDLFDDDMDFDSIDENVNAERMELDENDEDVKNFLNELDDLFSPRKDDGHQAKDNNQPQPSDEVSISATFHGSKEENANNLDSTKPLDDEAMSDDDRQSIVC